MQSTALGSQCGIESRPIPRKGFLLLVLQVSNPAYRFNFGGVPEPGLMGGSGKSVRNLKASTGSNPVATAILTSKKLIEMTRMLASKIITQLYLYDPEGIKHSRRIGIHPKVLTNSAVKKIIRGL
jgi:hypothetical protein